MEETATSGDIGQSIDSAIAAFSSATPTPTPATSQSTPPVTDGTSPTPTPAPRSGSERRSPKLAQPEGATTQPAPLGAASTATPEHTTATPGEPPREKWDQILGNARRDTERDTIAKYGGVTPDQFVQQHKPHLDALNQNPVGYYNWLGQQLQARGLMPQPNGQQGAPQAQSQSQAQSMPEPSLEAVGQDGRRYGAYSADDVKSAIAFSQQQLLAQLEPRLQPIEELRKQQESARIDASASQHARELIAEAETWPEWDTLKPKVADIIAKDRRRSVHSAYQEVYKNEYLPNLKATTRQAVLDELKTAPASQTIAPNTPARGNGKARGVTLDDRIDATLRALMPA